MDDQDAAGGGQQSVTTSVLQALPLNQLSGCASQFRYATDPLPRIDSINTLDGRLQVHVQIVCCLAPGRTSSLAPLCTDCLLSPVLAPCPG